MRREEIKVWRLAEFAHLEMRRGTSVAAPYPKHWHEEYQVCLIENGGGELLYGGVAYPTPSGSLFVLAPGETHANRTDDKCGCSFRSLYLSPEWMRGALDEAMEGRRESPVFTLPMIFDRRVMTLYRQLHLSLEIQASRLERESRLLEFLMLLVSRCAAKQPTFDRTGSVKPVVRRLREFIADCFAENITLKQLSSLANLSPYHLNRVFSAEYGLPPHAFQTQLRIARAKRLLREGTPISDVAVQTGFADQSHLTRHFKRLVRMTPGQYQRDSKNVQDLDRSQT